MDVDPVREGLLELRDVGDVSQDPELDLAVVSRDDLRSRGRDESAADLSKPNPPEDLS